MPDTFFRNEKEAKFHDIIQPNLYVRVFPNGDVLYSIRVSSFALLLLINYFPTSEPKNTKKDLICKIHKTYLHRTWCIFTMFGLDFVSLTMTTERWFQTILHLAKLPALREMIVPISLYQRKLIEEDFHLSHSYKLQELLTEPSTLPLLIIVNRESNWERNRTALEFIYLL